MAPFSAISANSSAVQCFVLSILVCSGVLVYWDVRTCVLLALGRLSDMGYGKGQYGKKRLPYGQIIDGER